MKTLINLFLLIVTGFLGFLICLSLYTFYVSVHPERIHSKITPEQFNIPYEKVYFSSSDGIILSGWFVPKEGKKTDKVVILAHGYPADKGDIFGAYRFLRKDYNLFLFDFRYHGESGGKYTTIGYKEVQDLLSAIDYLKGLKMKQIAVVGFSMGGAVALMSLDKTTDIKAVVSDSAYARLDLMAMELYKQIPFLAKPLTWLTDLWSRLFLKISLKDVSPLRSVKHSKVPMLIIHSKEDQVIPLEQGLMLQEALKENPKGVFYIREEGLHGMSDPEYEIQIRTFLQTYL